MILHSPVLHSRILVFECLDQTVLRLLKYQGKHIRGSHEEEYELRHQTYDRHLS